MSRKYFQKEPNPTTCLITEEVFISQIRVGDKVLFKNKFITVGKNDLKPNLFLGICFRGDASKKKIRRVINFN